MEAAAPAKDGELNLAIRAVKEGDFHFILSAWMKSYRSSVRGVPNVNYYRGQQNLIAELGRRRTIVVACDEKQPDYLYGFACGVAFADKTALIDYVYVKQIYRGKQIARGLLTKLGYSKEHGAVATHITPCVQGALWERNVTYNPYYNCVGYSDV